MKFLNKIETENSIKLKFLGFTIYKKITGYNFTEKTWCKILFRKYKQKPYNDFYILKKCYLFNILVYKQKKQDIQLILKRNYHNVIGGVRRLNTIAALHQRTFSEYKNINQGKTVVIVGAGPSVNFFEPINEDNVIYIGCNRAFLNKKVAFDYLFSIDKVGIQNYYDEFLKYREKTCIKFLGDQNLGECFQIPESYINKFKNAKRYKTTAGLLSNRYTFDIDSEPLGNFNSVAMQAMQFALFTNPSKIYLVGIDCDTATSGYFTGSSTDTSFRGESQVINDNNSLKYWARCEAFRNLYYPETKIISINPVRLKGMFEDVYTESYLHEHPEIKNEQSNKIKIIKNEEEQNV